jgi:hypothetical protein
VLFVDRRFYGFVSSDFLGCDHICYAMLESVKTSLGNSPSDSTAISSNKKEAFIKCYQEHLERKKLAFNVDLGKKGNCLNYCTKNISKIELKAFGYGCSSFGFSDTTGTASGLNSEELIKKCVCELIEKNECLLLWYANIGKYIKKAPPINEIINKHSFLSDRVEIFRLSALSNYFCFLVVLIENNRLIASGAAMGDSSLKTLVAALQEAKLLEWQNKDNPDSSLNQIDAKEHSRIVEHINKIIDAVPKDAFVNTSERSDLKLAQWINSIYITALNKGNDRSDVTLKCISKELFHCLPKRGYLLSNSQKEILLRHHILPEKIEASPEYMLL